MIAVKGIFPAVGHAGKVVDQLDVDAAANCPGGQDRRSVLTIYARRPGDSTAAEAVADAPSGTNSASSSPYVRAE